MQHHATSKVAWHWPLLAWPSMHSLMVWFFSNTASCSFKGRDSGLSWPGLACIHTLWRCSPVILHQRPPCALCSALYEYQINWLNFPTFRLRIDVGSYLMFPYFCPAGFEVWKYCSHPSGKTCDIDFLSNKWEVFSWAKLRGQNLPKRWVWYQT